MRLYKQNESIVNDIFVVQDMEGKWCTASNEYLTEKLLHLYNKYEILRSKYKKIKKKYENTK